MRKINLLVLIILISICWLSCDNEKQIDLPPNQDEPHFINENLALNLLKNLSSNQTLSRSTAKTQTVPKDIKEFTPINDEVGKTVFYIANYDGGGFTILAADDRISPILAYSDDSQFALNTNNFPSGLVEWLSTTKETIQSVRALNTEQVPTIKKEWEHIALQNSKEPDPNDNDDEPSPCEDEYYKVGPLLTTTWHQGSNFNYYMPVLNCSPPKNAAAGCVPIAVAQVMRYHQHPASYNWANMPDKSAANETALLIRDIHNAMPISYECEGTGVGKNHNVASTFTNIFGYSSASQANYNYTTVMNELRWGRPVILRGGRKSGWWVFASYKDGHAWVCDGFSRSISWSNSCNTGHIYIFLHMNWGWGRQFDGWYTTSNFNPGNDTYNYDVRMVYNIKP